MGEKGRKEQNRSASKTVGETGSNPRGDEENPSGIERPGEIAAHLRIKECSYQMALNLASLFLIGS
jgi:hypothetical protein